MASLFTCHLWLGWQILLNLLLNLVGVVVVGIAFWNTELSAERTDVLSQEY